MIAGDRYRPRQVDTKQRTLFPIDLAELRRRTSVSVDEMRRWRERGWLVGVEPGSDGPFEPAHEMEVRFVAALARSGLEDRQVDEVLSSLDPPYAYDPDCTMYSFESGTWFGIPDDPDPYEIIEESLGAYLSELADDGNVQRLDEIRVEVARALERANDREESR